MLLIFLLLPEESFTLDRLGILSLVTWNLPVTTDEKTTRVTLSPRMPIVSVSQSFSRKPPTLSRCLALARERSADVVSALCIELRAKARIRHRRSRPNAGPRRACSRRRGPLVADIICMTANYRLPRDNITRREQMPVVFGDHIPSSRRASMSAGSTPVSPTSLRSPSVVSRTTFRPRG